MSECDHVLLLACSGAGQVPDMDELKEFFSQGIEAHTDSLYGLAFRLTRNRTDAEDLVAESVARAWSAIASLEDRRRFRSWLFRILHNCYISAYRKKSVRPDETPYDEYSVANGEDEIVGYLINQSVEFMNWWGNPEKEFVNGLLGEHIMTAIEDLPEVFGVTVLLVNVEGFTYDEAAEVLGVPSGTIRSRMKRGRTLLQKALWKVARDEGLILDDSMCGCKQ